MAETLREVLLDHAPIGTYIVASDWKLLHVNPAGMAPFEGIADLYSRDFREIVRILWPANTADWILSSFQKTFDTGEPFAAEFNEERHDIGTREYYDWKINRVSLADGQQAVICYFSDVSKHVLMRLELEERSSQLRIARDQAMAAQALAEDALAAKRRFLSTVSHEVRTPMAGILGLAELMQLQDLGGENNQTMSFILESAKRLLQMLNNVLDASRLDSGTIALEQRMFPVRSILGDVRQLIAPEAEKKNLTLTGNFDENIPELICGDELRLRQILLNLAFNALKYTDQGTINIGAELKAADDGKHLIRFTVSDTGPGLTEDQKTQLFSFFEQTSETVTRVHGGSGLGLGIARELVSLMHGKIGVDSTPGKGSNFWFELPFSADECAI